jgi:hypothetical protein
MAARRSPGVMRRKSSSPLRSGGGVVSLTAVTGRQAGGGRALSTSFTSLHTLSEIGDQPLIHIQVALVFALIPDLVAFREHAPGLMAEYQRVWHDLKDDVPAVGPVPSPT